MALLQCLTPRKPFADYPPSFQNPGSFTVDVARRERRIALRIALRSVQLSMNLGNSIGI